MIDRSQVLTVLLATALATSALSAAAAIELISTPAYADLQPSNGASSNARASADLSVIVFESAASNLVDDDSNARRDVFVRAGQNVTLISRAANQPGNGDSVTPDISADGDWVVFSSSANNLVADDSNNVADLFLFRRSTGQLRRLSPASGQANGRSYAPRISDTGQYVAFLSAASNWVASDGNGLVDAFVYDVATNAVRRASNSFDGGEISDAPPSQVQISGDGACVAIETTSAQYVAADTNEAIDHYLVAVATGAIWRASVGPNNLQLAGMSQGRSLLLGCDGLIFETYDPNVSFSGSPGIARNIAGQVELLPLDQWVTSSDDKMAISRNLRYLAIGSERPVGPSGFQQRFDLQTWSLESSTSDFGSVLAISDNGARILSESVMPIVPGDRNAMSDLVLREAALGAQVWISQPNPTQSAVFAANGTSEVGFRLNISNRYVRPGHHALSADGRYVLFSSQASNLVIGDSNQVEDVFRRDRQTGQTVRVSTWSNGQQTARDSAAADLSGDGRFAVMESCDSFGFDLSGVICHVFVRDLQTGIVEQVNVSSNGVPANRDGLTFEGHWPRISDDGRFVVFVSSASNLDPAQTTFGLRVYLRDRQAHTTVALGGGTRPSISHNGRYVVWRAAGRDLALFDLQGGGLSLLPLHPDGALPGDSFVNSASISDSGRYIAYYSNANGLVASDQDDADDVFLFDRQTNTNTLISTGEGLPAGVTGGGVCEISADGRRLVFITDNGLDAPYREGILVDLESGYRLAFAGPDVLVPERDIVTRPRFSNDGRHLVFGSSGLSRSSLDQTGDMYDVYVTDTEINRLFANGFE